MFEFFVPLVSFLIGVVVGSVWMGDRVDCPVSLCDHKWGM